MKQLNQPKNQWKLIVNTCGIPSRNQVLLNENSIDTTQAELVANGAKAELILRIPVYGNNLTVVTDQSDSIMDGDPVLVTDDMMDEATQKLKEAIEKDKGKK